MHTHKTYRNTKSETIIYKKISNTKKTAKNKAK